LPAAARPGIEIAQLEIRVRNVVDGELAGQFTGRVRAHPVGDHQQVAAGCPRGDVARHNRSERILIVRAAHTQIGH